MSEYLVEDLRDHVHLESHNDVPTEVSVVSEKAAFLQSLCKSTGLSDGMGSSRYSRFKPGVLHFLEAPESSRVISVEAPVIAKIPKNTLSNCLVELSCQSYSYDTLQHSCYLPLITD